MCIGAFIGFARFLFSLSTAVFGINMVIVRIVMNRMEAVFRSLIENRALNFTLSMFVWLLVWEEDPFLWRRAR